MCKRILTADAETNPFRMGETNIVPFVFGVYEMVNESERFNSFWGENCIPDFVAWIEKQDCICYIHNGGGFDFHFFYNYIDNYEKILIINGKITSFKIGKCEFRDSLKIMPVALREINKDEFKYGKCHPKLREKYKSDILYYLKKDCQYLHEAVTEYRNEFGTKITLAGNALAYWRKIAGEKNPVTDSLYYEEIFPFYYGGRVECFKKGVFKGEFKVIDINSAYPYAMTFNHPWGSDFEDLETLEDYEKANYKEQSFLVVTGIAKGCFPYRDKESKKLIFPNDNEIREYSITGWEYETAKRTNTFEIVSFESGLTPYKVIDFKSYVDHFFHIKEQATVSGNKTRRLFSKLFLNSLYGKFAVNGSRFRDYYKFPISVFQDMEKENNTAIENGEEIPNDFDVLNIDAESGEVILSFPTEEERYLDAAVSASITGFVRAYLFEAVLSVDVAYYCDTDSLIYTGETTLELHPTALGKWDMEAKGKELSIAGKKLYALDCGKGKFKIASKGARLKPHEIKKVASGGIVKWRSLSPTFSIGKKPFIMEREIKQT